MKSLGRKYFKVPNLIYETCFRLSYPKHSENSEFLLGFYKKRSYWIRFTEVLDKRLRFVTKHPRSDGHTTLLFRGSQFIGKWVVFEHYSTIRVGAVTQ